MSDARISAAMIVHYARKIGTKEDAKYAKCISAKVQQSRNIDQLITACSAELNEKLIQ